MATMSDAFPSKYLSAEDLRGKDHAVVIEKYQQETMKVRDGTEELKYILFFRGAQKGLVLNKTNGKTIAAQHGNDFDGWIGKQITIGATWVESFGDQVLAIRVRPALAQGAADVFGSVPSGANGQPPIAQPVNAQSGQPSTEPFTDESVAQDHSDEIPF